MGAAFGTRRSARTLRDEARFSPEQAGGWADAVGEALAFARAIAKKPGPA